MLDEIESKTMHKYKESDQQRKKSKALIEKKPVQGCATQRMWGGGVGFFWNLSVFLTKCVDKISRPNLLSINLEYFSTKKKKKMKDTILSLSSPPEIKLLTVMMAFNHLMHNFPKWSDTLSKS